MSSLRRERLPERLARRNLELKGYSGVVYAMFVAHIVVLSRVRLELYS